MSDQLIKPNQPAGYRDYSPAQMVARREMVKTIESVYRRFGFLPLQTATGHKRNVLTGNQQISNRLWNMSADSTSEIEQDQQVSARFDLTVPLARYVASNIGEISWPFRRFEVGNVFRGESPQAGRYCEFMQFDVDIVGAPSGPADAEIIVCMMTVMRELGIERFLVKVNSRKILNGFAAQFGFAPNSDSTKALLRTMDKIDKIGVKGVIAELKSKTPPPGEEDIFAFDDQQIARVTEFLSLTDQCTTNEERLSTLKDYFPDEGPGQEGVKELELIAQLLEASGVNSEQWTIDPSVARGLGYYTGPVFETVLLDKQDFGSVYSGGRYDDLVARFTGESLPSVGASVGVDRLFAALEALDVIKDDEPEVDVFIITIENDLLPEYFTMAKELRDAGLRVEINMNYQDTAMRSQMTSALKRGAPIVLFYGARDARSGTVMVKDTRTRKQHGVPRSDLASEVLATLNSQPEA